MIQFPYIEENYKRITENVNNACLKADRKDSVKIMAVVKNVETEKIEYAKSLGITCFGENKAQELMAHAEKINGYVQNYDLHFIGVLQNNKVKYIIDKVNVIESVDSVKLLSEISRLAVKKSIFVNCLLEVNIGNEDTKSGIKPDELKSFLEDVHDFKNIGTVGLMTIPPREKSEFYFGKMHEIFEKYKSEYGLGTLSMGMSGDYETAIRYGSNIVRIGTALFGNR